MLGIFVGWKSSQEFPDYKMAAVQTCAVEISETSGVDTRLVFLRTYDYILLLFRSDKAIQTCLKALMTHLQLPGGRDTSGIRLVRSGTSTQASPHTVVWTCLRGRCCWMSGDYPGCFICPNDIHRLVPYKSTGI